MKGYYITYEELSKTRPTGVQRKIMSQIKVLNNNNLNCSSCHMKDGSEKLGRLIAGFIALLPYGNFFPRWNKNMFIEEIDYLYFRRPIFLNWAFRNFLSQMKKRNPKLKVIMEIPTFPYENEYKSIILKLFLLKDKYNREKIRGLVDVITVVAPPRELTSLWGIPVIPYRNGYDVENVEISKRKVDDNEIHLLCIAMFNIWHGYERLLYGLIEYYKGEGKKKIVCHFVGEGPELKKYKKIAEHPLLKDKVIFYGVVEKYELDRIYDNADIGICSLGTYKKLDFGVSSELKSREYIAKGLPVVVASAIDIFDGQELEFVCQFENNDSFLEIDKIINFYERLCKTDNMKNKIRMFAEQNVDINVTMRPIVDYITGER